LKNYLSRKDRIKIQAIEIIFEEGFGALNVKTIAEREGVAPSLLYKYYSSMEELLQEVISELGKFDKKIFCTLEKSDTTAKEKLTKFISTLLEYYENYPQLTPLLHSYENFRTDEILAEEILRVLNNQKIFAETFFYEGQENGEFTTDYAPEVLASILIGSIKERIFEWRVNLRKPHCKEPGLKVWTMEVVDLLLYTFENKEVKG